ncbi:MAG: hypothetical protein MJ180_00270 [Candidatus Gastranaerophilales bacterium]|nr:hypothetical protein [Candidatus Gastranaerophilales bacterium]
MSNNIYNFSKVPSMPERILSALAYLTCGFVGIILIIASVFLKVSLKPFVKFNCYQSILLGFVFAFLQLTYNLIDGLLQLLQIIPWLGSFLYSVFAFLVYYLMSFPILFGFSLLSSIIILALIYLIIVTLAGKNPYIPFISDAIKRIM